MFKLEIDDVDVVVLRRIILTFTIDLEMSQAKVESDNKVESDGSRCIVRISERGFRFINYAQQLGHYAKEGGE